MSTEVSAQDVDYPGFTIEHIQNPSRLWALPVIGACHQVHNCVSGCSMARNPPVCGEHSNYHQFVRRALYRQVLGACVWPRSGLDSAIDQAKLLRSRPCRCLSRFLAGRWRLHEARATYAKPAEPLLCRAFDWRFRPHAPPNSLLHILVCDRNRGLDGVLDCLGSRVICGTVS